MKKKPANKSERAHMSKVAQLGCIACSILGYETPCVEIHHIRPGRNHKKVIPLCVRHHRGDKNAIHSSKVNFERDFGTELELLEKVNGMVAA